MQYLTIDGLTENTTVIERSKFICVLKGIDNEEQAKEFIASVKKQHSLANHNCYAYIADEKGLIQKFSDDGEPQGTAGMPMLEILRAKGLYKTVAVVTRYFGGIKLGTGGLVRAYSGAVSDCVEKSKILSLKTAVIYEIYPDYDGYSKLFKLYSDEIKCVSTDFGEKITVKIAVVKETANTFIKGLNDVFSGKIDFKEIGEEFFPF